MTGSEYVLAKFRERHGRLTTGDFITDIHTAAEYRRIICDLKKKGHLIVSSKIKTNLWSYQLIETEASGQTCLPLCAT